MHYSIEAWADFARRTVPAGQLTAMQSHLNDGCGDCSAVFESWRAIRDLAAADSRFEPPASALHLARVLYRAQRPRGQHQQMADTARLLFDSRLATVGACLLYTSPSPRD